MLEEFRREGWPCCIRSPARTCRRQYPGGGDRRFVPPNPLAFPLGCGAYARRTRSCLPGLSSSGQARGEAWPTHPVVEGCGARADRDAGDGLHISQLNPVGGHRSGRGTWGGSRDRETVAGGGASRRVRCGRFSLKKPLKVNSADRVRLGASPHTDLRARATRRGDA